VLQRRRRSARCTDAGDHRAGPAPQ
jgi:hypothetical protein